MSASHLVRLRRMLVAMVCALAVVVTAPAQANDRAQDALAADYDAIIGQLTAITRIPAPPFGEEARAKYLAEQFRALGLRDVEIDEEGNVLGIRPGVDGTGGPLLTITAHMDTVFPAETELKVTRDGDKLLAPGIGDDSLGLSALLAWIRALDAGAVETARPILFVATVGEEGPGDLRGVRHLHNEGRYKDRIAAFVSVDGSSPERVVTSAVGSKRYRIAFVGPGGHSYGAFGIVSPMAAMADAVQRLYTIKASEEPRVTYAASVVEGGRSVNTIPDRIELLVDMRSPDAAALDAIEARFLAIIDEAVTAENLARSTREGEISAEITRIGDRPAGGIASDDPLVVAIGEALAGAGLEAEYVSSSTDANIAMSKGIPAIAIGTGGGGGRAHALDEYLVVERAAFMQGLSAGLDFVIRAAGRPE